MSASCPICIEPINSKRTTVTCPACNYYSCISCMIQYFTESKASPQCMNCHKPFNQEFLRNNIKNSKLNEIFKSQKEILFNEQQALFPHSQEYMKLQNRENELKKEMQSKYEIIRQLKKEINDIYTQMIPVLSAQRNYRTRLAQQGASISTNVYVQPKVYLFPCIQHNCKGFVEDKTYKCGLCETLYCKSCQNENTENHECKEEDILSVKMIKKDSKPCPKCSISIHRISGCADMFCTSCYTTFNWNTLQINENGNSNPLYYRWLREGANLNFNPNMNCNNVPLRVVFSSNQFKNLSKTNQKNLSNILNSLHHTINTYYYFLQGRNSPQNFETTTLSTRIKYLQNKISKESFKTQLMKTYKLKEYDDNIIQIRNLVNNYFGDAKTLITTSNEFNFDDFVSEYTRFTIYINDCVTNLRKLFYEPNIKITIQFIKSVKIYDSNNDVILN